MTETEQQMEKDLNCVLGKVALLSQENLSEQCLMRAGCKVKVLVKGEGK